MLDKWLITMAVVFLSVFLSSCGTKAPETAIDLVVLESEMIEQSSLKQKLEVSVEVPETESSLLDYFDDDVLEQYFGAYEQAAFVLSDGTDTVIYNEALANQGLPPFSTFKIPNSIIALETGVITAEDSMKQWDGTVYLREVVNGNHDLASAMENSVVWYYQELARDIGAERMKEYLHLMSYGNCDISGGIDRFWLGSSLSITPIEQVEFLIRFYNNDFGFSDETIDIVKSIIKQKDLDIAIYGKSGSSGVDMSWFVGYILEENIPYFFAVYLEDKEKGLEAKALSIDMFLEILEQKSPLKGGVSVRQYQAK